ncbi:hypothetical protein B0E37_01708 [Streptomyces sp. MH192]|nr:hypothetical protein [Streptomyces sp. MH192]MCF0098805.1 hypothetical protein [Streptomyces sp. MH191]
MAVALVPEAAGLIVDVHEGSAEDIRVRLAGMSRHELEGLAVVLAALADPDRPLKEALAWVTFDEYGNPLPPSRAGTRSDKAIRDAVPVQKRCRTAGVDVVAVHRALTERGEGLALSQEERRLAIEVGVRRGMPYELVASRLGMEKDTVKRSWERVKERARAEGRVVPTRPLVSVEGAA